MELVDECEDAVLADQVGVGEVEGEYEEEEDPEAVGHDGGVLLQVLEYIGGYRVPVSHVYQHGEVNVRGAGEDQCHEGRLDSIDVGLDLQQSVGIEKVEDEPIGCGHNVETVQVPFKFGLILDEVGLFVGLIQVGIPRDYLQGEADQ